MAARRLPSVKPAPQGTFQDELEWCISQLEANLLHLNSTPKQAEETKQVLKVLCSHETPLVKKQQVMNQMFGDYHLKMAENQKRTESADMKPGDVEVQQSNGQASGDVVHGKLSEAKPDWFPSSGNGFQSDLTLSEVAPEARGTLLEAVPGVSDAEQIQTNGRATQQSCNEAFSFPASGQEPRFASPEENCPLAQSVPASQHTEHAADPEVLGNSLPAESSGVPQISAWQKPELTQATGSAPKEDRNCVTLKISQTETASGDEIVTEKSAAEGAAQKKKKKKKQKPSLSKNEIKETEINRKAKAEVNTSQNKDTSHQDETSQQSDEKLWKEVDWCVEQLELGLKTQKPTPKQAEEALRAIRTLRSDKAPLARKRQLMRTMFGDYRKKMEEEWCKELRLMEAAVKSARVVEVQSQECHKSQFIRKSLGACRTRQASAGSSAQCPRTPATGSCKFTTSQEEFRFNFLQESLLD